MPPIENLTAACWLTCSYRLILALCCFTWCVNFVSSVRASSNYLNDFWCCIKNFNYKHSLNLLSYHFLLHAHHHNRLGEGLSIRTNKAFVFLRTLQCAFGDFLQFLIERPAYLTYVYMLHDTFSLLIHCVPLVLQKAQDSKFSTSDSETNKQPNVHPTHDPSDL